MSVRIRVTIGIVGGVDFGRLQVRLGDIDTREEHQLYQFILDLAANGDAATLIEIRDGGRYALLNAYHRHLTGYSAPGDFERYSRPLAHALETWLNETPRDKQRRPLAPKTIDSYRQAARALIKIADRGHTIDALPDVLRLYLHQSEQLGHNFPYRRARTMCLCYARNVFGNDSQLYANIKLVPNMHADRKRERQALEPQAWHAMLRQMRKDGNGHLVQHAINLTLLACRPDEYIQPDLDALPALVWLPEHRAVKITKGKTKAAVRFAPMCPGVKPPSSKLCRVTSRHTTVRHPKGEAPHYSLSVLQKAITKATFGQHELYDLRGTGTKWWEWAGISERAISMMAGHGLSVSQRYRSAGVNIRDWQRDLHLARKKMRLFMRKEGLLRPKPSR